MYKYKKFYDWDERGIAYQDGNQQSIDSQLWKERISMISKDLKFNIVFSHNTSIDIWFPDGTKCDIMEWCEENLEKRWTHIYSKEHLHFLFELEEDLLKFVLMWGEYRHK